jgi:hypothetical protein
LLSLGFWYTFILVFNKLLSYEGMELFYKTKLILQLLYAFGIGKLLAACLQSKFFDMVIRLIFRCTDSDDQLLQTRYFLSDANESSVLHSG